jgi:hypothetical protein
MTPSSCWYSPMRNSTYPRTAPGGLAREMRLYAQHLGVPAGRRRQVFGKQVQVFSPRSIGDSLPA